MAWDRRRRRDTAAGPLGFVLSNLTLAACTVIAFIVLVLARTQEPVVEDARAWLADFGAPVMEATAGPAAEMRRLGDGVGAYFSLREENERLRKEIASLRAGQGDLAMLRRKVQRYEELLKIPAEAAAESVAARVIADASGPFAQTVLVNAGRDQGITKGQAVVDERGLVGRVIHLGNRSARVLLLTDLNSRIPVMIEGANLKAILVGDNSSKPVLEYLPPGSRITVGARVVTTPDGDAFPPGVPVGAVAAGSRTPRVELFTAEGRADFVRILRYAAPLDVDETPDPAAPAPPATKKPAAAPLPSPAPVSPQARVAGPQAT